MLLCPNLPCKQKLTFPQGIQKKAYELGLYLHPQQWCELVHPALLSRPVHRCIGHAACPNDSQRKPATSET